MSKPVILTGLRANNDLHIGNYFGALLPLIDMAKNHAGEYQINLFVPDLHSFTTPIDHFQLQSQIKNNLRLFAAAGLPLDNPDVFIYRQSYIPAHSELTWILDCFTYFGELSRMTQFKEKSPARSTEMSEAMAAGALVQKEGYELVRQPQATNEGRPDLLLKTPGGETFSIEIKHSRDNIVGPSVGLFNYPVLMAADILLHNSKYVPVGDDQSQHIEFARDLGERLNNKFDQELFVLPEPVAKQHEFFGKEQGLRIKDLQNPDKKMSKSEESDKGVIFLNDTPELAHQKVMGAATDSVAQVKYDPENQPGISNLLQIYGLLTGKTVGDAAKEFEGQAQYGEFKKVVADKMAEFLLDFQAKLSQIDQTDIDNKLEESEKAMNKVANQTLLRVQKTVGLR